MGKSTVCSYKKTVWDSCALYVKLRDCSNDGMVKCCTCEKVGHYTSFDAGHFVPGRGNEVLYDDTHIFPQCAGCNCKGGGEQYKFGVFLQKKYGYSQYDLDEILSMRHRIRKFTLDELRIINKRYKEEIKFLKEKKGIQ